MKLPSILFAGTFGTSAMTLFSYLLSAILKRNFKEPELLSRLYNEWRSSSKKEENKGAGWLFHYAAGFAWVCLYRLLIKKGYIKPGATSTGSIGIVTGIIAMVIWKFLFVVTSNAPATTIAGFLLQLIPAHIVFAAVVFSMLGISRYYIMKSLRRSHD